MKFKNKQTKKHHQQKEASNQPKCSEFKNCITATGRFITIKSKQILQRLTGDHILSTFIYAG